MMFFNFFLMKVTVFYMLLCCLNLNCSNAQVCPEKDIATVKLYPPYTDCDIQNLAKIINNASEVFLLLPVKEEKNGSGYLLKSSRFLEKYWDKNEVDTELQKLPYEINSIKFELYDFGIIWDFNLTRFKQKSTCDLLSLYFDNEGNVKHLGNLNPIPFVVAELILRDVKVFLNNEGDFVINNKVYCP